MKNKKFKYTEDNPLRVFTAFSGYDSQCMALDRINDIDTKIYETESKIIELAEKLEEKYGI